MIAWTTAALAILGVVLLAAAVATFAPGSPLAAGGALLLGCLGVLLGNVIATARRANGPR